MGGYTCEPIKLLALDSRPSSALAQVRLPQPPQWAVVTRCNPSGPPTDVRSVALLRHWLTPKGIKNGQANRDRYRRTYANTDSVRMQGRHFPSLYDAEVNLDKIRRNEDI